MSTISLVTLPRGRAVTAAGDRFRWSIYVSMRLDPGASGEATLAAFPALADWPALLAGAEFTIEFAADDGAAGARCDVPCNERADSALWQRLFHPALPVHAFADGSETKEHVVRSIASGMLVRSVDSVLKAVRESGERSRATQAQVTAFSACRVSEARVPLEKLAREWPADPFEQFGLLNSPVEASALTPGDESKPTDFHRALSAVQEYPDLLRRLGLAVDFESELAGLEVPPAGMVRMLAKIDAPGFTFTSPWTAYETTTFANAARRAFHARRADSAPESRVAGGLLLLSHEAVALSQLNANHAVLALSDFARQLEADGGRAPAPEFPAQFTSGLALLDPRGSFEVSHALARRGELEQSLFNAPAARDGTPPAAHGGAENTVLYVDDVVLGYRVDVCAGKTPWRSLCARSVALSHAGSELGGAVTDEGYVAPSAIRSETDELVVSKVHDALFDWDGWSLVVPRPGKSVDDSGAAVEPIPLEDTSFPLRADLSVPAGSLERLRYGASYRFRARAVDLSGASLSVAEADAIIAENGGAKFVSSALDSARYEPIGAPLVVPATEPGHGEGDALFAVGNEQLSGGLKAVTQIYIAPPRASLTTLERHGALDDMSADQSFRYLAAHQNAFPTQYDAAAFGKLVSRHLLQLEIPYLSDPLAAGVVFLDLPGARGPVGPVAFPSDHGERYTIKLTLQTLEAGAKPREPKVAGSEVTVYLPAGERHAVRLLCVPPKERLLEIAHAVDAVRAGAASATKFYERLAAGDAPYVSPALPLKLVHAVQRPVEPPAFDKPALARKLGAPGATLADDGFRVHEPSTARVDFVATWTDFSETDIGWLPRAGHQPAFGVDVKDGAVNPLAGADTSHAFPDQRFHRVAYRAIATSRYRSFFTSENANDYTVTASSAEIDALATGTPAAPEPVYVVPTFRWTTETSRRPFKVRRTRMAGGLRIYMQPSWFSSGNGELLGVALALDSNAPIDPVLESCVTTWGVNPIVPSAPLPSYPTAQDLTDARHALRVIAIPPEWTAGKATGRVIAVASYRVEQEPRRRLLYCDIELAPRDGFLPMVQLALLRHQPKALPEAALSRVVRLDSALLLPERTLTVATGGDRVALELAGVSCRQSGDDAGATSRVVARIETRDRALRGEDLGWTRFGEDVVLDASRASVGPTHWRGEISVPATKEAVRVVVMEYVPLPSDSEGDGRLVFADAVAL